MRIGIDGELLRKLFRKVYFITGTAYAGKSTVARMLAEAYDGVMCEENFHNDLYAELTPGTYPNLCYFQTMRDWNEFLNRTPEEYDAWASGCGEEAAELEILLILQRMEKGRPVFVDTNIPLPMLHAFSDQQHVAVLLSPQSVSVERFFDRSDPEKQFLLRKIAESPDPQATMDNFRACIARVNSREHYEEFVQSGFFTYMHGPNEQPEETLSVLARHFGLLKRD